GGRTHLLLRRGGPRRAGGAAAGEHEGGGGQRDPGRTGDVRQGHGPAARGHQRGGPGIVFRARHRAVPFELCRAATRIDLPMRASLPAGRRRTCGQDTAPPVSQASAGPAVFSAMIAPTMPTAQENALVAFFTAQSWTRSRAVSARSPSRARTPHSTAPGSTITAQYPTRSRAPRPSPTSMSARIPIAAR